MYFPELRNAIEQPTTRINLHGKRPEPQNIPIKTEKNYIAAPESKKLPEPTRQLKANSVQKIPRRHGAMFPWPASNETKKNPHVLTDEMNTITSEFDPDGSKASSQSNWPMLWSN